MLHWNYLALQSTTGCLRLRRCTLLHALQKSMDRGKPTCSH